MPFEKLARWPKRPKKLAPAEQKLEAEALKFRREVEKQERLGSPLNGPLKIRKVRRANL